jgi:tRNA modification GTPase
MNNVIVALATAPLKSALALIRLSGDGVFSLTDDLFTHKISGITKREVFVGDVVDDKEIIDNVVLVAYPAPHTMTGEDVVEISCHGSPLIANEIINAYLKRGARYATRGEFSARAFYAGKMDLVEAESINDLINATTKEAKNLSLLSLKGETSKLVQPLKTSLADLLSLIEVNIDYPEYTDIEVANEQIILKKVNDLLVTVNSLIDGGEKGQIIKDGVKVAIVGEPNVGKSSLLNAMLKEDKAIVSDIPGTTRDVVEGSINLKGVTLNLLDTAGIREGATSLENLGIAKSQDSIAKADIVILVIDSTKGLQKADQDIIKMAKDKILITVYNKEDLLKNKESGKLYVSALKKDLDSLYQEIYKNLNLSEENYTNPSLCNVRQLGLLNRIKECLNEVKMDCTNGTPIDLISVNLRSAYNASRELLGEEATLDLTDEIFSRFCVGK